MIQQRITSALKALFSKSTGPAADQRLDELRQRVDALEGAGAMRRHTVTTVHRINPVIAKKPQATQRVPQGYRGQRKIAGATNRMRHV